MKMELVGKALPEAFPFYHLGTVESSEDLKNASTLPSKEQLTDCTVVGFRFSGDVQGLALVLFDRGLDLSTYTEMGNLMAGRFATRLSIEQGVDVMISPPFIATEPQLARIRATLELAKKTVFGRSYRHLQPDGRSVPVELLIVPIDAPGENPRKGAGHA